MNMVFTHQALMNMVLKEFFNIHCFDFLGLDFAINTSANEEFIHSNLEIPFLRAIK